MQIKKRKGNKYEGNFKVGNDKFIKLRFDDPKKIYVYVKNTYPDFRWANVFLRATKNQEFSILKDGTIKYRQ